MGESYAKWDSISQYYPTIVFVFVEVTESNKPRKSQIKIRFNKTWQEITDKDIQNLTNKIKEYGNLGYTYGTTRGNYVSKDKRFKTTIYAKDKENISNILSKVLDVLPDKFDPGLLSLTILGSKRPSLTKRTKQLANIGLNTDNYNDEFSLKLKSANLLVNGVKKIIKLPV